MDLSRIEELLKNHDERIRALEISIQKQNNLPKKIQEKIISIKEFILEKEPKGGYQIGLAIAYYIEMYQKIQFFTSEDLELAYREAKVKLPSNIHDIIYVNVQRGYLMEAKERKNNKKAYSLTITGETFVQNNFQK